MRLRCSTRLQRRTSAITMMSTKFQDPSEGYEQNATVTAIDAYTSEHLLAPSRNKYHETLEHAYKNSIEKKLPDISIYPAQGKFLAVQARITGAKNILEIGTLGAYSTIWMGTSSSDVKITTIEIDPHHKEVAEENIKHAGMSDRIEVLLGAGVDVLPNLLKEVESGKRAKYDFVFIDADKESNLAYFEAALAMARPGTCIYVDNVIRRGRLASEDAAKDDPRVAGTRKLIESVGRDDRVEAVVLQTVSEKNYDGFLLAVVK